jgi:Ca2+-binding RTX toxin-like protein
MSGGNLVVTGTASAETIEVRAALLGGVSVFVNNSLVPLGTFGVSGKIIVNAGDGNDAITINGDVKINADVFGGAGNDTIVGGGGHDYLDGGADNDQLTSRNLSDMLLGALGDDTLLGGNGRDLLIGGDGSDSIAGDNAEDILIAGSTAHDGNRASLDAIQGIWNGGASRDARIATLETGWLASSNIIADNDLDLLIGGNGTDYFLPDNWAAEVVDATLKEMP